MASVPLYDTEGKEIGTLPLPDAVFGAGYNEALVHQAIVAEEANYRQGNADTRSRSEVRGGGRKPWRQKGTGRARQGTIRAPHWRHGGVVFGPTPRDYRKALPVQMRRGAIRSVLSGKVSEGAVLGLESITLGAPSTRTAAAMLKALGLGGVRKVLVVLPEHDPIVHKSTRNIQGVELRFGANFSVRDALSAHRIVIVRGAEAKIEAAWAPRSMRAADADEPEPTEEEQAA